MWKMGVLSSLLPTLVSYVALSPCPRCGTVRPFWRQNYVYYRLQHHHHYLTR
ncbi:unnamed protein product [Acanthoscelides obtectus]|uniref:Secreted protein n=1 Tax=Acanthoscelides obtectus TaxID=200917 RepID=A0A9P0P9G5_ACAOB|nr:unnamed protein product [Acanthoscelides obtectus]CAK1685432.1 hypothetical protein AOBTE_LOCUS35393 [Acanthoscelides obtectus]